MSEDTERFGSARQNERQLNARQCQVLDLLVAGKTNAEIGATLGMTLDGAKWNVSEILTKLGLSSREEAADYWRWRSRPRAKMGRLAHGMLTFQWLLRPLGKAVVVAGLAVTVITIALSLTGDEKTITVGYYFEATYFERHEGANFTLDSIADADQGTLRAWYQDPGHFRFESTTTRATNTPQVSFSAADGQHVFANDGPNNTLTVSQVPPGFFQRAGPPNFRGVGPKDWAPDVQGLVQNLNQPSGGLSRWARVAGDDTLLGLPVLVVEFGPTWRNGEKGTSGGTGRMWIEPVSMFVLKQSTEGNDGTTQSEAVITQFMRNERAPADVFSGRLPAGSATTSSPK